MSIRDSRQTPGSPWRQVEVTGTPAKIAAAKQLLDYIAAGEAGAFGAAAGGELVVSELMLPRDAVRAIIGRGGATIRGIPRRRG